MPRTSNATTDIHTLVTTFANDLTEIVKRTTIEDIIRSISERGGDIPIPYDRGSGRKARVVRLGKAKRKGGRRSDADVAKMGESLLAYVKSNPGKRGEEIAKALKTDVGTMRLPMKALIKAKKVKTKGQKRGMTYTAA